MDKRSASEIARKINPDQLESMLRLARVLFKSWKSPSQVNRSMTKGYSFNVYWATLESCKRREKKIPYSAAKNMIHDFGDYLPDSIKPSKSSRRDHPEPWHKEPMDI